MEQLNPSEISDIIKQRIESLDVFQKRVMKELLLAFPMVSLGFTDCRRSERRDDRVSRKRIWLRPELRARFCGRCGSW